MYQKSTYILEDVFQIRFPVIPNTPKVKQTPLQESSDDEQQLLVINNLHYI